MQNMIDKTGDSSLTWCQEKENLLIRELFHKNVKSHEHKPILEPLAI
jgi:hypothetical protein